MLVVVLVAMLVGVLVADEDDVLVGVLVAVLVNANVGVLVAVFVEELVLVGE